MQDKKENEWKARHGSWKRRRMTNACAFVMGLHPAHQTSAHRANPVVEVHFLMKVSSFMLRKCSKAVVIVI